MSKVFCAAAWLIVMSSAVAAQERAGVVYRLDEANSRIVVVTGRSGALGFLGHEHAILATRFDGALCADPADLSQAALRFNVATSSLVIDSEEARQAAGLGKGPGAGDVREIQQKLLDRTRLAADSFPVLSFATTSVRRAGVDSLAVTGTLMIRGVTRGVAFPARVTALEQGIRLEASLRVRQSEFGIRPERVAGVVRVRDEVDIRIRLVVQPTAERCSTVVTNSHN